LIPILAFDFILAKHLAYQKKLFNEEFDLQSLYIFLC